MKVLHLTLKRQWYDLILSGEKKEEYREIKQYWCNRLLTEIYKGIHRDNIEAWGTKGILQDSSYKPLDIIQFTNGYSKTSPSFKIECLGIEIGKGKSEWGAPAEDVFIIKLGQII